MKQRGASAAQHATNHPNANRADNNVDVDDEDIVAPFEYSPSFKLAFLILALVRSGSAVFNIMSDCDEVFNYWEPTHFMLYGYGLQTWEYRCALKNWR
jgi:hypothetical protein